MLRWASVTNSLLRGLTVIASVLVAATHEPHVVAKPAGPVAVVEVMHEAAQAGANGFLSSESRECEIQSARVQHDHCVAKTHTMHFEDPIRANTGSCGII